MLKGKTIAACVTGGIAAYKAAEVVSSLVQLGADVHVAMTSAATRFVTPLSFRTLSGQPVITDMFAEPRHWNVEHIALAERADLFLVAPATANVIGKLAGGIADDFITTTLLATTAPVLLVPAMNHRMYAHPIVQRNLATLQEIGYYLMEPEYGRLASGAVGKGRFPAPARIVQRVLGLVAYRHDLAGRSLLVTAGPTHEPMDPVRYLSNRSSGKMGYALARAAWQRGARVTLVSGLVPLEGPEGVKLVVVETARDMREAVMAECAGMDAVVMAAAVADFRPRNPAAAKMPKSALGARLELEPVPDIIAELGSLHPRPVLVGFAAETHDLLASAREKLRRKQLDLICANDVSRTDAGMGSDQNQVTIITARGEVEELPLLPKDELAHLILDRVRQLLVGEAR
jgi:phosphopantothenoylcysteine decarboxylase/phosphopantothenate--cysteine ligase